MPRPPAACLLGKLLMAVIVAAMVGALLLAMALLVAGVALTPGRAAVLLLTDALGVVPFCALGLLVVPFIRGQAAPGLLPLVYLPMAFLCGLWFPLHVIPPLLRTLAPVWPSYPLHALSLAYAGQRHGGPRSQPLPAPAGVAAARPAPAA